MWDTKASLPPDRKDFTVKEIKQLVQQGIAENKALRGENVKLKEMVKKLASSLKETNLFNAKVMQVNKLFTRGGLTAEQKRSIVESIDAAESISEVKKIGVTLERTLKSVGVVAEGAKRKSVSQRAGKSGGADQKVLRESVDKGAGSQQTSRWEQLAGLK